MPAGLGSLVEVLATISQVPRVEVLSVRASSEEFRCAGEWLPTTTVEVHAEAHTAAFLLGVRWGLDEEAKEVRGVSGGRPRLWRSWSGWVRELSGPERRVWLRVTAAEPFDLDADPLGFKPPAEAVR